MIKNTKNNININSNKKQNTKIKLVSNEKKNTTKTKPKIKVEVSKKKELSKKIQKIVKTPTKPSKINSPKKPIIKKELNKKIYVKETQPQIITEKKESVPNNVIISKSDYPLNTLFVTKILNRITVHDSDKFIFLKKAFSNIEKYHKSEIMFDLITKFEETVEKLKNDYEISEDQILEILIKAMNNLSIVPPNTKHTRDLRWIDLTKFKHDSTEIKYETLLRYFHAILYNVL